jgi:hypothetical protein
MDDSAFSDQFCRFLQGSVPSVLAAELLLALAKERDRWWEVGELVATLPQTDHVAVEDVWTYIDDNWRRLVAIGSNRKVRYRPAEAELDDFVQALAMAYNERPVTLIRLIYAFRDSKIQSFAQAFRIKR